MKKASITLIFISLLILINCKSHWIKNSEMLTKKISTESILVDQFEDIREEDYYLKIKLYKSGKFKLIKSDFFVDTLMQSKSEIYLKDSIILEYKYSGLDAIMNPKNKNAYAKISEQFYYLKNREQGVLKEREIEITSFKELKKAQIELNNKEFKERVLTKKDILKIEEEYKELVKKLTNYN